MSLSLENFLIQTPLKMSPFVIYRREFKDKKSIKTSPLPPPCWLNWNLWSFSKCQTSLSINPNLKCTFPTIAKLSLRKLVFGPKLPFGLNQISVPEVFNTLIFCIFVYTPLPLTFQLKFCRHFHKGPRLAAYILQFLLHICHFVCKPSVNFPFRTKSSDIARALKVVPSCYPGWENME